MGGVSFDSEVVFDEGKVRMKIMKGSSRAQKVLDSAVVRDSNYYCPQDTSTLQKSAIVNTVIGSGTVRWVTPYAREQYYNMNFTHERSRNPNATAKWFETAKARNLDKWLALVERETKK